MYVYTYLIITYLLNYSLILHSTTFDYLNLPKRGDAQGGKDGGERTRASLCTHGRKNRIACTARSASVPLRGPYAQRRHYFPGVFCRYSQLFVLAFTIIRIHDLVIQIRSIFWWVPRTVASPWDTRARNPKSRCKLRIIRVLLPSHVGIR